MEKLTGYDRLSLAAKLLSFGFSPDEAGDAATDPNLQTIDQANELLESVG